MQNRGKVVIGKKVNQGEMSWKGAELTVDCYLGNVGINEDNLKVKEYIENAGITLVDFQENKRNHERFKYFKLTVKRSHLTLLEDPELWPEGVVIRNFFRPRQTVMNSHGVPSGALSNNTIAT
jgi:hypothetical protein